MTAHGTLAGSPRTKRGLRASLLVAMGMLGVALMLSPLSAGSSTTGAFASTNISADDRTCVQTVSDTSGVTVKRITQNGKSYCVIEFADVGKRTWTVPSRVTEVEYLVVAGGGGGGSASDLAGAGGGGAGGVLQGKLSLSEDALDVVVGEGGAGGQQGEKSADDTPGVSGSDSEFGNLVAKGGGGGAKHRASGLPGGSGGGAGTRSLSSPTFGGGNDEEQGNPGGDSPNFFGGAGGGGAGGPGKQSTGTGDANSGGVGGKGITSSIDGTEREFAKGGSGGIRDGESPPGADAVVRGSGGGGGSSRGGPAGGKGADGIVIVRYVLQEDQTIIFSDLANQTYSTTPVSVSATASSGLSVTFASDSPSVCAVSGTSVTLLGEGTCEVRASQGGNGAFFPAPDVVTSFTIERAAQTIDFSVLGERLFAPESFAVTATATSGLAVVFTSTTTDICTVSGVNVTMVREGTCSLTGAQPGNDTQYLAAESITRTFAISKAAQAISFTQPGNRTYGDSAFTVTVSTDASGLTPVVESTTTDVCTVSSTSVTIVSAGECSLRATQAGDDRYNAASPTTRTLTVSPKALTISGSFTVADKTYDGTTTATIASRSLSLVGTVGADVVGLELTVTFATRDAGGDQTVSIAAASSLSGAQAGNYTLSLVGAPTATARINPLALSVANANALTRVYDATTTVTITGATLQGVITGDAVTLTGATSGTSSSADVGTHAVTTTMALDGTHAGNYTITQPTLNLTISPRPVSLSGSRVYDGTTNTAAAVLSITGGLVGSEELILTGSATTTDPDVGEPLVLTPADITLGDGTGGKASNYTLTGGTHTLTITQRPLQGTFEVTGRPYDGTTGVAESLISARNLAAIDGDLASGVVAVDGVIDDVELVGGTATFASADANEATPTVVTLTGGSLSGTRAANYTLDSVSDTTAIITRRPITVTGTFSVSSRVYDGTTSAEINTDTLDLALANTISGDDVTLAPVAVFDQATVGDTITVRLAPAPTSTLEGTQAANYLLDLGGAPTTTAAITPRSLTVSGTFTVEGKTYDGTNTATITDTTLTLANFADGDSSSNVTWTPLARFTDVNAGTRTAGLVGGAVLGGAKGANYTLSLDGAPTATATITRRSVTIAGVEATSRVYDGTTTVALSGGALVGVLGSDEVTLPEVMTGTADQKNVGTHDVTTAITLGGAQEANYELTQPQVTVEITRRPVTVTMNTLPDRLYDRGTDLVLQSSDLNVTGVVDGESITVSGTATLSDRRVGTRQVTLSGPNYLEGAGTLLTNYALPASVVGSVEVTPVTLGITGAVVTSRPWDNTTTAAITGAAPDGVLGADIVSLIDVAAGQFASDQPGIHTVTFAGTPALEGADAGNYTLNVPTLTGEILLRGQTIAFGAPGNRAFSPVPFTVAAGVNDVVASAPSGLAATFASSTLDVCTVTGSSVTLLRSGTCTLTATQAGDTLYEPATAVEQSFTVTLATQTITFTGPAGKTYGAAPFDITSAPTTDAVDLSPTLAGTSPEVCSLAGSTLTILAAGECSLTATQGGDDRYLPATTVVRMFTVSPRPVSLTGTRVYDGTTNTAAAVLSITGGLVGGETLTLTGLATTSSPDVGESVALTPGGITLGDGPGGTASNYTLTGGTHTITITQRPVRGTFTVTGRPYDGTTGVAESLISARNLAAVPGNAASGVVAVAGVTDDVRLVGGAATFASADANETTPTVLTLTGGSITGARAANYTLESVADTTATITARPIRLSGSFSVADRTYDGSDSVTPETESITLRAGDVVAGDTVELGVVTFIADSSFVGVRTATPQSTISGASAANYVLVFDGAPSATFTITPASLTVSSGEFTPQSRLADGTTNATITSHDMVLQGFVGGDTPGDITWTPTGVFDTAAAGANKTVTLVGGAVFGGVRGAEYVLDVTGAPTAVANITQPPSPPSNPSPQPSPGNPVLTIPTTPGGVQVSPPGTISAPGSISAPGTAPAPLAGPLPGATGNGGQAPTAPTAIIGGLPATVNTNVTGGNQVSVQTGGTSFGLSIPQGQGGVASQGGTTELAVQSGAQTRLSGSGLFPGSTVQVFMPLGANGSREIAQLPVDPSGSFDGDAVFTTRPTDPPLPIGRHILQIASLNDAGERVVVEMAINIAQPAPAPEILRANGEIPSLTPGQSLATRAGEPTDVLLTVDPELALTTVEGDGWGFLIDVAGGGNSVEETAVGGALISVLRGGQASMTGNGFLPLSRVDIWLFSDPTLLGSFDIDENGEFTGTIVIDGRVVPVGDHTLQIQGVGVDGFVLAANLGVVVSDADAAGAATTEQASASVLWWVLALIALLAIIGTIWWWRTRRQAA